MLTLRFYTLLFCLFASVLLLCNAGWAEESAADILVEYDERAPLLPSDSGNKPAGFKGEFTPPATIKVPDWPEESGNPLLPSSAKSPSEVGPTIPAETDTEKKQTPAAPTPKAGKVIIDIEEPAPAKTVVKIKPKPKTVPREALQYDPVPLDKNKSVPAIITQDFGDAIIVESSECRKQRFRTTLNQADKLIESGNFKPAIELCVAVLEQDPGNFRARILLENARNGLNAKRQVKSTMEHDTEFDKRMREVEEASIPYIETRKVNMVLKASPYSQEIKMKEESQEITALRKELNNVLVDLDFRNSDLREVVRYLAETSEINIVIDENALLQISQPVMQTQMAMPQQIGGMQNAPMNQQTNNGLGLSRPAPMAAPVQPVMPGQPVNAQQQYNNMQQNQQFQQQQQYLQQRQNQQFQQQGQYPNQQMQTQGQTYPQNQQMQQQPPQQNSNGSGLVGTSGGVATYQAAAPTETSPKVTIYLRQVPLLSALDIILRSKGLRYRIEKNYIWISTEQNLSLEEMVTRIYTIQHAIGDFENFSAEALNLGNSLLNTQTYGGDTSSQFFNNINNSTNRVATQAGEKTEAQAAENLISTLKQVVPQPQGAQMTLYARTGKLIVRNTPSNLKILEGLLRNLDVSSMQVAIEVRLLEVISEKGEDLGAVFDVALSSNNYSTDSNGTIASGRKGSLGLDIDRQGISEMFSTVKDSFSLVFDQAGTVAIHASVNALVAQNKATLLSSPKLTCLNNQTANIQVATVQNYIAAQESNVVSNTSSNYTTTSQTIGQIPEGITLEITPNVSADQKTVRLTVHPKVTELQNLEPIRGYDEHGNSYIKNQLPTVTQRSLDTTVSVRNGGTLVLGGLMRGKDQYKSQGISGLSKIPVVGKAFKNKNEFNGKSNLIIFITARILNAEGDIVDVKHQEELKNVEVK